MSRDYEYYHSRNSEQFSFYRIPKALFTDATFCGLSTDAKLLYGLMLDRMELSRKSGWVDELDHVYIYYTYAAIQKHLGCSHNKPTKLLRELEAQGLIRRIRQGLGKPDRIYVMNFLEERGHAHKKGMQNPENQDSAYHQNGQPDTTKAASIHTDIIKTERSNTDLTISSRPEDEMRDMLKEKWGYIALLDTYPRETIDNIILLGTDILSSQRPTLRVGGEDIPTERVHERLLSLDLTHIDYVLETIGKTKVPIQNFRAYLLTALYNAPTTIDAYYTALFQRNEMN